MSKKKNIRFIINPISGVGEKGNLPRLIEKHLDHSKFNYDIIYTEYVKHAKTLAKGSIEEGIDIICAVGGDGSVNEVGSALINTSVVLAILPAGSGNGFARHLNIPLNLEKAIKAINKIKVKTVDTGLINGRPFLNVAGVGFDAHISKCFQDHPKRGFWSYAKLVLKEAKKFEPISIFWKDQQRKIENIILCTIANGREYGNGFKVDPNAIIDDNQLSMVIVKNPGFIGFLPLLFRSYFMDVSKSKHVSVYPIQTTTLELPTRVIHHDGEPVELLRDEIEISVVPKSLHVIVG